MPSTHDTCDPRVGRVTAGTLQRYIRAMALPRTPPIFKWARALFRTTGLAQKRHSLSVTPVVLALSHISPPGWRWRPPGGRWRGAGGAGRPAGRVVLPRRHGGLCSGAH
jgi:hypothetical protein